MKMCWSLTWLGVITGCRTDGEMDVLTTIMYHDILKMSWRVEPGCGGTWAKMKY